MNEQHDPEKLAAFAVGLLNAEDTQATKAHLEGCSRCRQELAELCEVDSALRGVPPELFLDGPPPGDELVLQRALRQVRKQRRVHRRRQRLTLVAAAVVVLAGAGAAGVALGRVTAGETTAVAPGEAGSRVLTGINQSTGTRMSVTVTPNAGWVKVKATIVGIPVGERCMLVVVDRRGNPYIAGSWLVDSVAEDYSIDSGVAVASGDVAAVAVRNFAGRELVTALA